MSDWGARYVLVYYWNAVHLESGLDKNGVTMALVKGCKIRYVYLGEEDVLLILRLSVCPASSAREEEGVFQVLSKCQPKVSFALRKP